MQGATVHNLIHGVYAITPERSALWPTDSILKCVAAALDGGVRLFQCRQKNWNPAELVAFVEQLNDLCEKHKATLILNDVPSAQFNQFQGAAIAGVHLGASDEPIAQARSRLKVDSLLGASCYNRIDLAQQAVVDGASYVAFGAMYPSNTKPNAVKADLNLFAQAKVLGVPTVAIGGIAPSHVPELMNAGAHALAVVTGLFGMEPNAAKVRSMAQQWVDAVEQCGV